MDGSSFIQFSKTISKSTYRRFLFNTRNAMARMPAVVWPCILLTQKCTQRCCQCAIPRNLGKPHTMSYNSFKRVIDSLNRYCAHFVTLSGGEPLLHPEIEKCIRYTAQKDFMYVQLLSSLYVREEIVECAAEVLSETGVGIQVSFDGFGEAADTIRGAKNVSDTVQKGIEILNRKNRRRKRPFRMSANIVISRLNLDQLPDIIAYFESIDWRVSIDLYRWSSPHQLETDMMKVEDGPELRRVLNIAKASKAVTTPDTILDGFQDYLSDRFPKRCPFLSLCGIGTKIFINPDLSVDGCEGNTIGNLGDQTFEAVFRSDAWCTYLAHCRGCQGCWNVCYTPLGIMSNFWSREGLKTIWKIISNG